MSRSTQYDVAVWFVEEYRGEKWYYPEHVKQMSAAKSMLAGGVDPGGRPIPAFTEQEIKDCVLALENGCHLTEGAPLSESEFKWMVDAKGITGLWHVRKLIFRYYNEIPDAPSVWDQPEYDEWVREWGGRAFKAQKFLVYQGWNQRGPYGSGIHPDELRALFGDLFTDISLDVWKRSYEK